MADNVLVGDDRVSEGEDGHLSLTLATPDLNLGATYVVFIFIRWLSNQRFLVLATHVYLSLRELNPSDTVDAATCSKLSEDKGALATNWTKRDQVGLAEEDAAVLQGGHHPPRGLDEVEGLDGRELFRAVVVQLVAEDPSVRGGAVCQYLPFVRANPNGVLNCHHCCHSAIQPLLVHEVVLPA